VINLIQVDCQKFEEYGMIAIEFVWSIFYLIFTFTASFFILGWVFITYIALSFLLIGITGLIHKVIANY